MYLFEDTIFERLLDSLKIANTVVVTSHLFYEYKTNSERVALAYELLEEEQLLPSIESLEENVKIKSQKLATALRNEGNKAFQQKKDLVAIQYYNRSMAAAPLKSRELSLAIGNRSAVNWSLGFYEACLCDIKQAFHDGYPEELQFKLLERRLKCCLKLGREIDAESTVKELQEKLKAVSEEQFIQHEANLKPLLQELDVLRNTPASDCVTNIESIKIGCCQKPPVSHEINEEIECASSCLALKYSEEKGRHLIATKYIKPGEVLLVEQPFASVLLPESLASHCYNCLARCLSPVPCPTCTQVIFCNEKCRLDAWERFHSHDCHLLPILINRVGKMGLLAVRVLLIASQKGKDFNKFFEDVENLDQSSDVRTRGFNDNGHYVSTEYGPIHHLIGHSEHRSNADIFRRSVTAALLLHCLELFSDFFGMCVLEESKLYFCGGILLQHLQSLPCNAHEVSEMIVNRGAFESQEIGAAGYATLSLLNHSCDPNVVRHSYGDWAVLRAIRPIHQGEDILDNYGYHHALHSVDYRQNQLSRQYFFHCLCQACQGSWPVFKEQPIANPVFRCHQCGSSLEKDLEVSGKIQCSCGAVNDKELMEAELSKSSVLFRKALSDVLTRQYVQEVPEILQQHLIHLSSTVQRPWREFSECQETMKQCLSLQANHLVLN